MWHAQARHPCRPRGQRAQILWAPILAILTTKHGLLEAARQVRGLEEEEGLEIGSTIEVVKAFPTLTEYDEPLCH